MLSRESAQSRHSLSDTTTTTITSMRIAKPLLLVMTPIGVVWGLVEAWRFHWWLAVLMGVLLGVISLFTWFTVKRIRAERAPP
ncbi:MAG TPA: hypothetical protein VFV88_18490 [Steroidobacteraceae bacterium]|jgi:hypothetical protein|nr:hypothetical protein [Steroidobacteraceae bacterium]